MNVNTQIRRKIALFLLSIFALWQMGALVHFVTVAHEICPHGQVVDVEGVKHDHRDQRRDPQDHRQGSGNGREGHDDCEVVALLTTAQLLVASWGPGIFEPIEALGIFVFENQTNWCLNDKLYRISPSHSPPALA